MKKIIAPLVILGNLVWPLPVFAHEAYVLTHDEFWQGLQVTNIPATDFIKPLFSPEYFQASVVITILIVLLYALNFFWAASRTSYHLDKLIKKAAILGPFIVRIALSASFFYAAFENSAFGPELSLVNIPDGVLIRFLEILIGLMILFGVLMEGAGLIGIAIFLYMTKYYGIYMTTYLNYFGGMLLLLLFGQKFLTFDGFFLGRDSLFFNLEKFKKFEVPMVRFFLGLSLIFAGISIKFLHQNLSIAVYNQYHLQNFFHANADFIVAGAGVSEILIGLFILLGFGMRLIIVISTIFITLSLVYFRELIWPHFLLYGLSFALFINANDFLTLDHYLISWLRRKMGIKV